MNRIREFFQSVGHTAGEHTQSVFDHAQEGLIWALSILKTCGEKLNQNAIACRGSLKATIETNCNGERIKSLYQIVFGKVIPKEERNTNVKFIGAAIVLSLGASQVVGSLAILANGIAGVWNTTQVLRIKLEHSFIKASLKKHRAIPLQTLNASSIDHVKRLQDSLTENEIRSQEALEAIKQNGRYGVASLISIIPVVGVIWAGTFLNATSKEGAAKSPSAIQRSAEEIMQALTSGLSSIVRSIIYPLGGKGTTYDDYVKQVALNSKLSFEEMSTIFSDRLVKLEAKEIRISVNRGDGKQHTLRCQLIDTNKNSAADTVIVFHGNAMIGEEMVNAARIYKEKGKNVLIVTMGGYPGSDEHVLTTESSTIQDVNAVLKHLENQGVMAIGVHGLSIGGTLAMHATQLSDKVKYCCIDKSFDSVRNVAANLISNIAQLQAPILKIIPKAIVRGLIGSGFPINQPVFGVTDWKGRPYTTDGCDNLSKAGKFNGVLVTISGKLDHFMGYSQNENGEFQKSFSHDLHQAHSANNQLNSFDCFILTGHSDNLEGAEETITQGMNAAFSSP